MSKVIEIGKPGTLILDDHDLARIAGSEDGQATLLDMKAENGLPPHAPVGVDSQGKWALPFGLSFKMPKSPFHAVRVSRGKTTVYITMHNCIG